MSIPVISSLVHYFRIFWGYTRGRIAVLIVLSCLTGLSEGFGIAMFMPLLTAANITGESSDALSQFLGRVLHAAGLNNTMIPLLALIVGLFFLKGVLVFVCGLYSSRLNAGITRDLRRRALTACARMRYTYYLQSDSGFFTNLISMEISRAISSFGSFCGIIVTVVMIAVFMGFSFWINWKFSLLIIAIGCTALYVFRFTSRLTRTYSIQRSSRYADLHSLLIQAFQTFKYLSATQRFAAIQQRLFTTIGSLARIQYRTGLLNTLLRAMTEPLIVTMVAGVLVYQVMVVQGSLAPVLAALLFFYRILIKILNLQSQWQVFISFAGSIATVNAATAAIEAQREPTGTRPLAGFEREIAFQGVTFAFNDTPVLQNVSLRIPKNSSIALIGASGTGKTTMVDLVTGILTPQQGAVLIDGVPLPECDPADWRSRIGYVTQDPVLFADTVAANISLWDTAAEESAVQTAARRANCDDFIREMPANYATHIGDRGIRLSGGQRQRIAIARELYKQPDVLILDEATSSLDTESEIAIQQSIDDLRGSMTVLLIAHRISTLRNADYIYVLDRGRVAEHGTFDELMSSDPPSRLRRMWELQNIQV